MWCVQMSPLPSIYMKSTWSPRAPNVSNTPRDALGSQLEDTRWKARMRVARGGWADPRIGRSPGPTFELCFLLVTDMYVCPKVSSRCMNILESVWVPGGPLDPCEVHVSLSDSSTLACLGLVTCLPPRILCGSNLLS